MKDEPIVHEYCSEELSTTDQVTEFLDDIENIISHKLNDPGSRKYIITVNVECGITKDYLWNLYLEDKVEINQ